jgi:hypothetical protein
VIGLLRRRPVSSDPLETAEPLPCVSRARTRDISSPSSPYRREGPFKEQTEQPQSPSLGIESSLVVRLHFVEAMMVRMFNALSESQQASIKQHFDDLLKRSENLEVLGVPLSLFRAYRGTSGFQVNSPYNLCATLESESLSPLSPVTLTDVAATKAIRGTQ